MMRMLLLLCKPCASSVMVSGAEFAANIEHLAQRGCEEGGMTKYETPELDGRKWTEIPVSPMKVAG
jgi:hypothetical protein